MFYIHYVIKYVILIKKYNICRYYFLVNNKFNILFIIYCICYVLFFCNHDVTKSISSCNVISRFV